MGVECAVCGKTFNSEVSLGQHTAAKHGKAIKHTPKKTNVTVIISLAIIVFIAVIAAQWYFSVQLPTTGVYDTFAQCLTEKGAIFYGTFWCPHCKDQKELFGSSMEYVTYVECSTPDGNAQMPVCTAAGIDGYPTWVFADGIKVSGTQTLKFLSEKTSCPLIADQDEKNETQ